MMWKKLLRILELRELHGRAVDLARSQGSDILKSRKVYEESAVGGLWKVCNCTFTLEEGDEGIPSGGWLLSGTKRAKHRGKKKFQGICGVYISTAEGQGGESVVADKAGKVRDISLISNNMQRPSAVMVSPKGYLEMLFEHIVSPNSLSVSTPTAFIQ